MCINAILLGSVSTQIQFLFILKFPLFCLYDYQTYRENYHVVSEYNPSLRKQIPMPRTSNNLVSENFSGKANHGMHMRVICSTENKLLLSYKHYKCIDSCFTAKNTSNLGSFNPEKLIFVTEFLFIIDNIDDSLITSMILCICSIIGLYCFKKQLIFKLQSYSRV